MKNVVISVEVPLELLAGFVKYCEQKKLIMKTAAFGKSGATGPKKGKVFLGKRDREVVKSRLDSGDDYMDIARDFNVSVTTVRNIGKSKG